MATKTDASGDEFEFDIDAEAADLFAAHQMPDGADWRGVDVPDEDAETIEAPDGFKAVPELAANGWADDDFDPEELNAADSNEAAKVATPKLQDFLGAKKEKK